MDNVYVKTEQGLFNNKVVETVYDATTNLPLSRTIFKNNKVVKYQDASELLKKQKYNNRANYMSWLNEVSNEIKEKEAQKRAKKEAPVDDLEGELEFIDVNAEQEEHRMVR